MRFVVRMALGVVLVLSGCSQVQRDSKAEVAKALSPEEVRVQEAVLTVQDDVEELALTYNAQLRHLEEGALVDDVVYQRSARYMVQRLDRLVAIGRQCEAGLKAVEVPAFLNEKTRAGLQKYIDLNGKCLSLSIQDAQRRQERYRKGGSDAATLMPLNLDNVTADGSTQAVTDRILTETDATFALVEARRAVGLRTFSGVVVFGVKDEIEETDR